MSIIACPGCGKKISSKAPLCLHCGLERGEATDADLHVYQMRQAREKIYRLNMTSYAVITAFVAGFGWYWWSTGGFVQSSGWGPFILMGASAVGYVVVRALLFSARSRLKSLKRNAP